MKGTLVQLQGKGVEDFHLTTNPEFSYFKTVYKRYTPFSMESIECFFNKKPKFGSVCSATLNRSGSLISKVYLEVDLPYSENSNATWTNRVGFNLIKKIELIIGDTIIERQIGLWMYLWSELSSTFDKHKILDDLIGTTSKSNLFTNGLSANVPHKLIIPINLYFCKNIENALPVSAITNQNITFKFYFEKKDKCLQNGNIDDDIINSRLWIDHIYVEKTEEIKIIQRPHSYLIEIPQHYEKNLNNDGDNLINIPFKLPCKELIWILKKKNLENSNDKFTNFTEGLNNAVKFASFYQHYNYGGWEINLEPGNYNNNRLLQINPDFNMLSSVKINGLTIILYTGNNFNGNSITLTENNSGLGIYNDSIRSIKILNNLRSNMNLLNSVQMKIDSKNIFSTSKKNNVYFNKYIPYRYHKGNPNLGIYSYPFCIYPEDYQPSGFLNLSNVNKFNLQLNCKKSLAHIFSLSYNVLEIKDNMCSLKYKY